VLQRRVRFVEIEWSGFSCLEILAYCRLIFSDRLSQAGLIEHSGSPLFPQQCQQAVV
jgi:hypothetical protein